MYLLLIIELISDTARMYLHCADARLARSARGCFIRLVALRLNLDFREIIGRCT